MSLAHAERSAAPAALRFRTARRAPIQLPFRWIAVTLASLFVAGGLWAAFAPQQIGGPDAYVITDGVSMLPQFRTGDLVVVRKEATYGVGEVAAFHNLQLHVVVLHRIVARRGRRYVFKGDNNPFATSYEPTKAQIVGAEWIHLPGVGKLVLDLREPLIAAVLLGLLGLYSFSPAARSRRLRRRHRRAR